MGTVNYQWRAEDEEPEIRKQRALFEAWAQSRGLELRWETVGRAKFYRSKLTRTAWHSWAACRVENTIA